MNTIIKTIAERFLNKNNRNTLIYLGSSIFGAMIGFLMLRKFTFYLGPEDIGIFGYVTAVNTFLIPFFTLNLETYYIKEVYKAGLSADRKKVLLGTLITFVMIWTIFFGCVFTFAGSYAFTALHIKVKFFPFMFYTLLSNLFFGASVFTMLQFRILSKPWMYFLVNALQTILIIGIGYGLVAYLKMGVLGRISGVLLGSTIMGIISLVLINSHLKWGVDGALLKKALRFSIPLIPYTLANLLYDLLDRYYLERYFDKLSFTGIYNMGAQYALIISMLAIAFYRAYETEIFRMNALDDHQGIKKSMIMLNNVMLFLAIPLIIVSKPLMNYLTHGRFPGSALIASLLIVAFFFRSAYIMLNTILTAQSRTKEIMYFSVAGLVFVMIASGFLVRLYDNVGTAIIKIALYMLLVASSFLILRKSTVYRGYILHTVISGGTMLAIILVLRQYNFL